MELELELESSTLGCSDQYLSRKWPLWRAKFMFSSNLFDYLIIFMFLLGKYRFKYIKSMFELFFKSRGLVVQNFHILFFFISFTLNIFLCIVEASALMWLLNEKEYQIIIKNGFKTRIYSRNATYFEPDYNI